MTDSDKRAKDDLKALPIRKTLGDRLLARVGRRAWERPNVAISTRLYQYYDIQDPWDPNPHRGKWDSKLGPVSLRLGENKRQPARHLKPKESKNPTKKTTSPAKQFKPKGIPKASKTKAPAPPPTPKPKQPQSKLKSEFGGGQQKHKLFKMPMRPELADQIKAEQAASEEPPTKLESNMRKVSKSKPQSKTKRSRPRIVSGEEAAQRSILRPQSPEKEGGINRFSMRRTKTSAAPIVKENASPDVQPSQETGRKSKLPAPDPSLESMFDSPKEDKPKRFSMRRNTSKSGPTVKSIAPPKVAESNTPKESPTPQPPPKPVDSFSLDDLFGAGGGQESGPMRMKRHKNKKDKPTE